jgi:hypothetical protein
MSSNINSIAPFLGGTTKDALESIGITQFPAAASWYQVIGGLIVQGGYVEMSATTSATIPFNAPYGKQVLGVWLQTVDGSANGAHISASPALDSFEIVNGSSDRFYYWLSLGV